MNRKNELMIGIFIVVLVGIGAMFYGIFLSGPDLSQGKKSILVLAVDESESRPGMGAVDMAFLILLENGSIVNYTPFYPGGMRHPTQPAPGEVQSQGAGYLLLMHDALWIEDTVQGMRYAKEIYEANKNFAPDAVIAVNTEAMNALISAADLPTQLSAADIVRENDQLHGGSMTRGQAVLSLVDDLSKASSNEAIRSAMIQAAVDQYSKGNIVMDPSGSFVSLLATKGINTLTGI